jgi:high-affinity nickel-transport protein
MPNTPTGLLALGFVLGLRHALDVDHLVAVTTIVSRRRGIFSSSLVGGLWGLGHTAALLAVATGVVALHVEIPPSVARGFEMAVAAMLVVLGVGLLRTLASGGTLHHHRHVHGGHGHAHPHLHEAAATDAPDGHHGIGVAARPVLVGLVHGLSGSAALMLAVAATVPSPRLALAYVAVFGVGSIGGMMVMSALVGVPFALAGARLERIERTLQTLAAAGSVAVGVLVAFNA